MFSPFPIALLLHHDCEGWLSRQAWRLELETGDWSWRLETGDWSWRLELETGDWRLEAGDWRLETGAGSWRLELETGAVESGDWRLELETGDRRPETGDGRRETGDGRRETGDWRLEGKTGAGGKNWSSSEGLYNRRHHLNEHRLQNLRHQRWGNTDTPWSSINADQPMNQPLRQ